MLLDTFGTLIADFMTVPPDISGVASASAILDVSNFTIQAVTFGKNATAYQYNAHQVLSPSTLQVFKVKSYSGSAVSSYYPSALVNGIYGYKLLPEVIRPIDTRLERAETKPLSSAYDLGHCQNAVISSSLSSYYHIIGCFPASGGTTYWIGSTSSNISGTLLSSGVLSGVFNKYGIMDSSGFLTIDPYSVSTLVGQNMSSIMTNGAKLVAPGSSTGSVVIGIVVAPDDLKALRLFGGIYSVGLWALDIRSLLDAGLTPPYSFNALNNIRKYRLIGKRSFLSDLTYTPLTSSPAVIEDWIIGGSNFDTLFLTWSLNFV